MKPGDILTVAGGVRNGPVQLVKAPIKLLSAMNYGKDQNKISTDHKIEFKAPTTTLTELPKKP